MDRPKTVCVLILGVLMMSSIAFADGGVLVLDTRTITWTSEIRGGELLIAAYEKGQHIGSFVTMDLRKDVKAYLTQKLTKPVDKPIKVWTTEEVTEVLRAKGYLDSSTVFSADMPSATVPK